MADERLRHLTRRDECEPAGRARLLRERVRAGALRLERLRLAAYLGDVDARAALGEAAPAAPDALEAWLAGLRAWGPEVLLRGLAAAREAAGGGEGAAEARVAPALPLPEARATLAVAAVMAVSAAAAGDVRGVLAAGRAALGLGGEASVDGPTASPVAVRIAVREALLPWVLEATRPAAGGA